MIKYLGSKKKLLTNILDIAATFPDAVNVIDLFSGTSRVGHAFKKNGYQVFSNDHNSYASTLARCYVQADSEDWADEAASLIDGITYGKGAVFLR